MIKKLNKLLQWMLTKTVLYFTMSDKDNIVYIVFIINKYTIYLTIADEATLKVYVANILIKEETGDFDTVIDNLNKLC